MPIFSSCTAEGKTNCYDEQFGFCHEVFGIFHITALMFWKVICDTFQRGCGNHQSTEKPEQGSAQKNKFGLNIVDHFPSLSRMACCLGQKCFYLCENDFASINVPEQRIIETLLYTICEMNESRNLFSSMMTVLVIRTSWVAMKCPEKVWSSSV